VVVPVPSLKPKAADTAVDACMVSAAVAELPFKVAVTVAGWLAVTVPVVAVKLPVVEPAATDTDAGTVRALLLSEIVTAVPAVDALESVTVQLVLAFDATVAGEQESAVTVTGGAVIVTDAVLELPFKLAVMVADWLELTVPAVTVKLAVVAPAATDTEAGTVNALLLSETATGVAAVGALESVTVQLALPFDNHTEALDSALDDIHERFGSKAVTRATLLGRNTGMQVPLLPD